MFEPGHCWGMGLGWLIPIIVLIMLFFFLFKEQSKKETSSAQDILDRRYANGEIDQKEYQEKSNDLKRY